MEKLENYQLGEFLGQGGFARVYQARCRATGREVAIKMVDKEKMVRNRMNERVRQEVAIHSRLKHPSILELYTFFEDASHVYLVLELCHNGELARYIKQTQRVFTEPEARGLLVQVVQGLSYLHGHGIMHRDLTMANLMLDHNMNIKIGDFGLATRLASPQERHVTLCGTPNFISPEVATRSSHGLEVDVWGLGCLLYTWLVGRPPFDTQGVRSTLTKVVMADFHLPDSLSPDARDLICRLLQKNPAERIPLQEIPAHNWVRGPAQQSAQDSGMFTLATTTTTGFSRGPQQRGRPALLSHYSEECEVSLHSSRLPAPAPGPPPLSTPLTSLRSKLSALPSAPCLPSLPAPPQQDFTTRSMHSVLGRQVSCPEPSSSSRVLGGLQPAQLQPRPGQPGSLQEQRGSLHEQRYSGHASSPAPGSGPGTGSGSGPGPKLSTTRLRPTRQQSKNVVASISSGGEVVLEMLKGRASLQCVSEVMRISSDGERIVLYSPGPGVQPGPQPPPAAGADAFYSYQTLPEKYFKKYVYAARFVGISKSATPKITLYTARSKSYLMENQEKDFELHCYSGTKVAVSGGRVRVTEAGTTLYTGVWPGLGTAGLPAGLAQVMAELTSCYQHCLDVEAANAPMDSLTTPVFPLVLGRKPQHLEAAPSNDSLEKENRAPVAGLADTLLSTALPGQGGPERQVSLPGTGRATQHGDGTVRVQYEDGAGLAVRDGATTVEYCPGPGSVWQQYRVTDSLPGPVRARLAGLPAIMEQIKQAHSRPPSLVR